MLVIRLLRVGKKNQPSFKIVVTDKRNPPRGGRFVEEVGFYNPLTKEKVLKKERIQYWLSQGVQPSDTVHNLLVKEGILEGAKIPVHKKAKEKGEKPKEEKVEEKPKEEAPKEGKAEEKPKEETPKKEKVEVKPEEKPKKESPKEEKKEELKKEEVPQEEKKEEQSKEEPPEKEKTREASEKKKIEGKEGKQPEEKK